MIPCILSSTGPKSTSNNTNNKALSLTHELDVLVEFGTAAAALGQEVEADAADVLSGFELLGHIYLVALYLELHQPPVLQAHLLAIAEMLIDDFPQHVPDAGDGTDGDAEAAGYLFFNLAVLYDAVMHSLSPVLAIAGNRGFGFLGYLVSHIDFNYV